MKKRWSNKTVVMTENEVRSIWRRRGLPLNRMVQCLADLNDCPKEAVRQYLIALGLITEQTELGRDFRKAYTPEERKLILDRYKSGDSVQNIAEELGRTVNAIHNVIQRHREKGEIL
jgi:DNA-directed RNA polymerase specialized sigma24 family protein